MPSRSTTSPLVFLLDFAKPLTCGFATVLLAALLFACGGEEERKAPNVFVILFDTLRPDHLGFQGYHRETAPFLSTLVEQSVVFDNAVSTSSWTAPATASLFTGLHPLRHGVTLGVVAHRDRVNQGDSKTGKLLSINRLPASVSTLPELFRDSGYQTYGIASNPNLDPRIGFARGFDHFVQAQKHGPPQPSFAKKIRRRLSSSWANADEIYKILKQWGDEIKGDPRPFFIYLHLNDVHPPYSKHADFYEKPETEQDEPMAAYDSGIGFADHVIERIYSELGLAKNTIFVLLSDHGEGFGEHGRFYHKMGVYGELNRIAWMVSAPSLGVRQQRIQERVSLLSVLPTLLELSGNAVPPDLDGFSLAPLLVGNREQASKITQSLQTRTVFAHRVPKDPSDPTAWAAMKGRWKLIDEGGRIELYDTEADVTEEIDLAAQHPKETAMLAADLAAFRARTLPVDPETVELQLDAESIEALRALGYVD